MKKEEKLQQLLERIEAPDQEAKKKAEEHWQHLAKPLHGMGILEEFITQIAAIQGTADVRLTKKGIVVMCADNGIVKEGVSQTGPEVTAIVAGNFKKGETSVCKMAKKANVNIIPVDIGMNTDVEGISKKKYKIRYGTEDFLKKPAMKRKEAVGAILTGIRIVKQCKRKGYQILGTGEMGIGNTTTSSAVACLLLNAQAEEMTGRGAGLSGKGLKRKIHVIETAISNPEIKKDDPIEILRMVGGLDLAGLAGVFLGCAIYRLPAVMDGFISSVAALLAVRIAPEVKSYIIASHQSKEPAHEKVLKELGKTAMLHGQMALGEGTGACAFFPLLDMATEVYREMPTFGEIRVKQYEEYR